MLPKDLYKEKTIINKGHPINIIEVTKIVNNLERIVNDMGKKYLITTAAHNAGVNRRLLENMQRYSSLIEAEIIILPVVGGLASQEQRMAAELVPYLMENKEMTINKNLKIKDFGVNPQQINPLTGLGRFAQGDRSYIMPGTKQVLRYIANSHKQLPKAVMTTGAITKPAYSMFTLKGTPKRTGHIAKGDHEYGFVYVEVEDDNYFHFRQITAQNNGNFTDLGKKFDGTSRPEKVQADALIVGDLHPYDTNEEHEACTFDQIKTLKPKKIFLHDSFNARSISHHHIDDNIRKYEVYTEQGQNLEDELRLTLESINKYASAIDGKVYIVPSNHDEHLYQYLTKGRFLGDKGNDLIGSKIYTKVLEGYNPLKSGLELVGKLKKNIVFLERTDDYKVRGYQLANHGDAGSNGARGSLRSHEEANGKSITGHTHTPSKIRKTYTVGTSTDLILDYNKRGYSSWVNTNSVIYPDGSVQLLNTIDGAWRIG